MRKYIPILLLAAACTAERDPAFDRPRIVDGPVPLKDKVAYVDGALDRVVLVDASVTAPKIAAVGVGRQPIWSVPTPDRSRLLVITRGEEALERGQVDETPKLWNVDVEHPETAPVAYEIGSPFDRIAISTDGHMAISHFSDAGPDSEG